MLCLSGFELNSRWVPLRYYNPLTIIKKFIYFVVRENLWADHLSEFLFKVKQVTSEKITVLCPLQ